MKLLSDSSHLKPDQILVLLRETAEKLLSCYVLFRGVQNSRPLRLFFQQALKLEQSPDFQRILYLTSMCYCKCLVLALRTSLNFGLVKEHQILESLRDLSCADVRPIKKLKVPDPAMLLPTGLVVSTWPIDALAFFIAEVYRSYMTIKLTIYPDSNGGVGVDFNEGHEISGSHSVDTLGSICEGAIHEVHED